MNKYFVCAFQPMANYRNGRGNTAAYFLTPDRKVLNIIAGKMNNSQTFIWEAKRAKYLNQTNSAAIASYFFNKLVKEEGRKVNAVHALLAASPYPKVEAVYWIVFNEILEEVMDYEMSTDLQKEE